MKWNLLEKNGNFFPYLWTSTIYQGFRVIEIIWGENYGFVVHSVIPKIDHTKRGPVLSVESAAMSKIVVHWYNKCSHQTDGQSHGRSDTLKKKLFRRIEPVVSRPSKPAFRSLVNRSAILGVAVTIRMLLGDI